MPEINYFWDEIEDNVVREYDENNNTIACYTTEPTLYGSVLSQHRGGEKRHYHYDGQGNTTELTDALGNVTDTRRYSAFGETTTSSGTSSMPLGFRGRIGYYTDIALNSMQVRLRILTQRYGRFSSRDPDDAWRGDEQQYEYALNSPINVEDPSGARVSFGFLCVPAYAAWFAMCASMYRSHHAGRGVVPWTPAQDKCLGKAIMIPGALAGLYTLCGQNVFRATTIPPGGEAPPMTFCIAGCPIFPVNPTYLDDANVDCTTCATYIQTVLTLQHECIHKRQLCIRSTACLEWEAYKLSTEELKNRIRPLCAQIAQAGLCKSKKECEEAIDKAVADEQHYITFFKEKCEKGDKD